MSLPFTGPWPVPYWPSDGKKKAQTGPRGVQGHAGGVLMSESWLEFMAPAPKSEGLGEAREKDFLSGKTPPGRRAQDTHPHTHVCPRHMYSCTAWVLIKTSVRCPRATASPPNTSLNVE